MPPCVCGCDGDHEPHCEHGCTIYESDWPQYRRPAKQPIGGAHMDGKNEYPFSHLTRESFIEPQSIDVGAGDDWAGVPTP